MLTKNTTRKRRSSANKRLVGLILGSAIVGIGGMARTKKQRSGWVHIGRRIYKTMRSIVSGAQHLGNALSLLFRKK